MKTKFLYPFYWFGSIALVLLFHSWLAANVNENIRLENYLQRQIEGYLSRVLPGNSYLVTVSVDAEVNRTQELKNETVDSYLKEENITPPTPPTPEPSPPEEEPTLEILPGLEELFNLNQRNQVNNRPQTVVTPNNEPTRNLREEESKTSREYTYTDQLNIREVSVQVAFDDSLSPDLVQSIKNLIGSKMDTTFGDRATVIFSTVDLGQVRQPDPIEQPLPLTSPESLDPVEDNFEQPLDENTNSGWDYYLDKYAPIIYLLLSILIFIVLLLLFVFFLWLFLRMLRKNEKTEERPDPLPPPNYPTSEPAIPVSLGRGSEARNQGGEIKSSSTIFDEVNARAKEEKFLDQFLREPLLSRKYFMSLPDEDKNELLSALMNNAIKGVFRDIGNDSGLGQDSIFKQELDPSEVERIRDNIFSRHIDGINQYNKIYASQMRDPFSKLSFFTEEELKTLFNSIGIETAAIIAKNVDSQKMVPYLNQLPEQKRKEFLKVFNSEKEVSQGEMEEFKRTLKIKTDDLSKNIFIRKADNKFIKRKLLESSVDKKKFLESIKNEDPDFYNENRGYMVDFNDFMADDSPLFNRTIQTAENEDVTLALIGVKDQETRNRLLNALPQIRRDFISGYVSSRQGSATREDIQNAQNNILDIYRNYLI